jgi:fructosamine-3-kinase
MNRRTRDAVESWADASVAELTELDGGKVGAVYRVDLADGRRVVAKTAETDLTIEARMLRHLAAAGLSVPDVFFADATLLVLQYIEGSADITPAVERELADRLAAVHSTTAEAFGFEFDTLTGPYRQPNPWLSDWPTFFGEHRLGHAATRAREEGVLPADCAERLEAVRADLPTLLDHDPEPALIHGDVWRENLLTDGESIRAFLDPACYYADREVELAYVDWTDTGGDAFFQRYREIAGIDDGFDERAPVYRLYPLLTHLRYFGEEYVEPLRDSLAESGY